MNEGEGNIFSLDTARVLKKSGGNPRRSLLNSDEEKNLQNETYNINLKKRQLIIDSVIFLNEPFDVAHRKLMLASTRFTGADKNKLLQSINTAEESSIETDPYWYLAAIFAVGDDMADILQEIKAAKEQEEVE